MSPGRYRAAVLGEELAVVPVDPVRLVGEVLTGPREVGLDDVGRAGGGGLWGDPLELPQLGELLLGEDAVEFRHSAPGAGGSSRPRA